MNVLKRVTTEFVDVEDRIRISGEYFDGDTDMLWLTQRLTNRLMAHLCRSLEQQLALVSSVPSVHPVQQDVMQDFAQQVARAHLTSQLPVRASSSNTGWRVDAVDITEVDGVVVLIFRGEANRQARLNLPAQALRQWLAIVYQQYQCGAWPMDIWPHWMDGSAQVPGTLHAAVMH